MDTTGLLTFTAIPACTVTSITTSGGPIAVGRPVHLLFWGADWQTRQHPVTHELLSAWFTRNCQAVVDGPWMSAMRQYGVKQCFFGSSRVIAMDPPLLPATYNKGDIEGLLQRAIDDGTFPEPDEPGGANLYVVFMPRNSRFPNIAGLGAIGGEHDYFRSGSIVDADKVWYAFVADVSDALGVPNFDEMIRAFSHELAEMCVDPEDDGWKVDGAAALCEEIGDLCNSRVGPVGAVQNVEAYWSVQDRACVLPTMWSVNRMLGWAGKDLGGRGLLSLQDPIPSLLSLLRSM